MKIGILTQPLHNNYGGLLQAYALKETIESLGHEVIIINRRVKESSEIRRCASILKNKILGNKLSPSILLSKSDKKTISQNTIAFREKYIPNLSKLITNDREMKSLNTLGFDGYIVGSDQSWRPKYSPSIQNYFLDFAQNETNLKRLTYSVSFGVSNWEFTQLDTKACASLVKKFDAISVREDSGIELVKNYLDCEATHLVDPTMLLNKADYTKITENEKVEKSEGTLKVYVLDRTQEKMDFFSSLEAKLGLKQFQIMPDKRLNLDKVTDIKDLIYPHPAKWLKGFQDAEFVITDSFHGTIFSILFNIPFLTIGNKSRGMARFESLLKMFDLENRLITNLNEVNIEQLVNDQIDWKSVNDKLNDERARAYNFLEENLK